MPSIIRQSPLFLLALLTFLSGCAQIPPVQRSDGVSESLLHADVEFLAQPALKGRAPRSDASALARQYITSRLHAYGLKPWAGNSYELPFVIGTNVIAVLPGSDPVLAREFIIFSAHYDHLGQQGFETYPGACDNASGDAALLEVAQTLAAQWPRPKRSILFAFFDCEEMGLLGSLAFSTRPDFDPHSVAAVVNIDMLGRHAFDLPTSHALVMVGTENYPDLRATAEAVCQNHGLNFLPFGRDLVGPRSDHAAFEALGFPSLLLTCGPNRDYHKPSDTIDKMDFALMERQVLAAQDLVLKLANQSELPRYQPPATGDRAELAAVKELVEQILAAPAVAGIGQDQLPAMRQTLAQINKYLKPAQPYSVFERHKLLGDLARQFMPVLLGKLYKPDQVLPLLVIADLYAQHIATFVKLERAVASEVIKRKPDLFHPFGTFEIKATAVDAYSIRVADLGNDQMRLSMFVPEIELKMNVSRFGNTSLYVDRHYVLAVNFQGTRGEVIDYSLLNWLANSKNKQWSEYWHFALMQFAGKDLGDGPVDWQKGLGHPAAGMTNRDWVRACIYSSQPKLVGAALWMNSVAHGASDDELAALMKNKALSVAVRQEFVQAAAAKPSKTLQAALVEELNDEDDMDVMLYAYYLDESFPFYNDMAPQEMRKHLKPPAPKKLKELAREVLKTATKQDHGFDQAAWRAALELPAPG